MKKGRYYLGRVVKGGLVTQDTLMEGIINSKVLKIGKYTWAITDVIDARNNSENPFIFGHLSKFQKEGTIKTVDTKLKQQEDTEIPDLLVASSPFVYLPEYSGIAYLHVWNSIQEELFARRFKSIIEATHENFFAECTIEAITDYRAFQAKLSELEAITEIQAKVFPPNPLFGHLWEKLRDYIRSRNATSVSVKEVDETANGLNTAIVRLIDQVLENPNFRPVDPPEIGDAAILMAADGYGIGKVIGTKDGEELVVKTIDTQKNFEFEKEPDAYELAERAGNYFRSISDERGLHH